MSREIVKVLLPGAVRRPVQDGGGTCLNRKRGIIGQEIYRRTARAGTDVVIAAGEAPDRGFGRLLVVGQGGYRNIG